MTVGTLKRGALMVSLVLFGVGCVNLNVPSEVSECTKTGNCRNGGKDAGTSKDTSIIPDSEVVPLVDALSPDAAVAVDTLVVVMDTKPVSVDSKPDVTPPSDVPSDSLAVDTLSTITPDAEVILVDAPITQPTDTGTPDTTSLPVDTRPDTTLVSDTSQDTVAPIDTRPATDAGSKTVSFSAGRGTGAMTGYGWVTLGSADTISSPTCVGGAAITSASLCSSSTTWSTSNALCMTGYVPALSTTTPDYAGNWGVQVGVNAKEPNAALGATYGSITLNVTGSPQSALRAELHRFGDAVGDTYCFLMTTGVAIPLTSFNTKCWEPASGVAFTEADVAKIDKVGVQVSSTTAGAIAVTNLCLNSIVFGN